MSSDKRICVVLLVGIPGSGKTYFRHLLEDYIKLNVVPTLGSVQMYSICYDNFNKVRNPSECNSSTWKQERLKILEAVENIVCILKKNSFGKLVLPFPTLTVVNEKIKDPNTIVILIDDNMYYRSMRFEYYKLAKIYRVSFCQIFFNIALDEALIRNEKRSQDSHVPETIIKDMFNKIQPPLNSNMWERNSLIISSFANVKDEGILNSVFSCIDNALASPVEPQSDCLAREEAKKTTSSNALHQIDNILKKLVSSCIQREIKINKNQAHEISQFYSEKRFAVLKQIKDGSICVPIDITRPISNKEVDLITPVLSELLKK